MLTLQIETTGTLPKTLQRDPSDAARSLALTARRRPVLVPRKVKEEGPLEREWYVSITDLRQKARAVCDRGRLRLAEAWATLGHDLA